MNKQEKASEIDALKEALQSGPAAFVLAPKGLTVNQVSALRRKVRASQGRLKVVKNRLALRALKGSPFEPLAPHFKGETAIAWTAGDPAPLAKALDEFAKENQGLGIKGGLVEGKAIAAAGVKQIADLPPRPVLVARFIGLLKSPMTRLVTVLTGPHRSALMALNEIAKKRGASAEGGPAAE
jgi:large subunit ribosomal protein L10